LVPVEEEAVEVAQPRVNILSFKIGKKYHSMFFPDFLFDFCLVFSSVFSASYLSLFAILKFESSKKTTLIC